MGDSSDKLQSSQSSDLAEKINAQLISMAVRREMVERYDHSQGLSNFGGNERFNTSVKKPERGSIFDSWQALIFSKNHKAPDQSPNEANDLRMK